MCRLHALSFTKLKDLLFPRDELFPRVTKKFFHGRESPFRVRAFLLKVKL